MIDLENIERLTSEDFKNPALPEKIYEIEDQVERQACISRCSEKARSYGLKGEFLAMIKAMQKKVVELRRTYEIEQKEKASVATAEKTMNVWIEPHSQTAYNTGKWSVTSSGVMSADSRRIAVACHYPIYIQERMTTLENGREKVALAWIKEGRNRSIVATRSQIANARKIVDLSDIGLPVTSESAKDLVAYLDDFEKLNPDIPITLSTGRFGWVSKDFVPYCPEKIAFETMGFDDLVNSVRAKGDYEIWLNMMKNIRSRGRSEVSVYLAASFGSVLVPLVKGLPFIVNLWGTTGAGKTVALMVAASVWADPSEHSYITESNSTVNAITKRLGILNNLPLMIDDLSKIRDADKRKFTELIYNICAGGGKGRLDRNTNMREVEKWCNITLSNLERPLTDETMQGGAINRVLDFEIGDSDIFEDGNSVVTVLSQHFGHAGKRWIEFVREYGIDKIKALCKDYEQRLRQKASENGTPKEQKQIASAALLLATDELTEREIFKDGQRLDFDYVLSTIKDIKTTSEMERAYWYVSDYVVQQQIKFRTTDYGEYRGEVWGAFLDDDWVAIIPTALTEISIQGNFSLKQFTQWMAKNGLLQLGNDKRFTKTIRLPGGTKPARAYVMKLGKEETEEENLPETLEFELPDEDVDGELPFM